MAWKERNVVDERLEFITRTFDKNVNFTELCDEFGISTKTGYKWKKRFMEAGVSALDDQSRRPITNSRRISVDAIFQIINLKNHKASWGPKKIYAVLKERYPEHDIPSESTVERVLRRAGFIKKRRRKRNNNTERIQHRVKATVPNEIWTVDFKGWWYTPTREKCEPLTVRDDFSKYILSIKILSKGDISCVQAEFERIFKMYGLPEVIRSDNGPPFASAVAQFGLTRLAAWWLSLGIRLDRIDPGKPQQNGSHERMHLDMRNELEKKINGDLKLHQSYFEVWRKEYNEERPHEALGMKTPASIYEKSKRKYRPAGELTYPEELETRLVNTRGYAVHKGRRIFISNAFNGFNVGIDFRCEKGYKVWFVNHFIGIINPRSYVFTPNNELITVIKIE